jgi:hypothetical protein
MPQEQNCWELAYTYGWGYPRADTIWPKVKTTHTRGGYMLGHSCCTLCTLFLPIPDRERAVFKYLAVNLRGCGQSHLGWMRGAKVRLPGRSWLLCKPLHQSIESGQVSVNNCTLFFCKRHLL